MTDDFIKAFNQTMVSEVGPNFNPNDPDVIVGLIDTPARRKKSGFTDIKGDRGGVTKFGIAQNSHTDISVKDLTLAQAMEIYERDYWQAGKCDKMLYPISFVHFDACVNHGLGGATKQLQRALGFSGSDVDGALGNGTLSAIALAEPLDLTNKILDQREAFFKRIVEKDPSQVKFLKGWLNRISHLRHAFTL